MKLIRKKYFVHLIVYTMLTTIFLLLVQEYYKIRTRLHNFNQSVISDKNLLQTDKESQRYSNWFLTNRHFWPYVTSSFSDQNKTLLFPDLNSDSDRIVEQLITSVPNQFANVISNVTNEFSRVKTIYLVNGFNSWNLYRADVNVFGQCPVNECELTGTDTDNVDALLFKDHYSNDQLIRKRPPWQVWILYLLECPLHTYRFPTTKNVINWTATYRFDSDIVTPYEKWVYYKDYKTVPDLNKNYAANKTKKVAWFVSNCGAKNKRLEYARELQNYIQVDIYGACGELHCSRKNEKSCFEMLSKTYKFYLAFENSNCKDYVTEKFYVNGLKNDILPIVMGAKVEDYAKVAPERSYIHVDEFAGPKELAQYLHVLDQNDDLYNTYFKWKHKGEFINTYFWCRLCTMLHVISSKVLPHKSYESTNDWWQKGNGGCLDCKGRDEFCSWQFNPV